MDMGDFMKQKVFNSHSTKIPIIWKIILLLEILIWIPLLFIGFDSHHDGLILTTVNMIQDSIQNKGEWPFNQYGPFWALPFSLITYALPHDWVFVTLRIVTVGFYFLTGFLIYHLAKLISTTRIAFLSLLIFFLSQPFVSDFGSGLVPWPSAVIMPMFVLVVLLFFRISVGTGTNRQVKYYSYIGGILVCGIFFSRAQIGFLMFLTFIFLLLVKHRITAAVFFVLGFLSLTLILVSFLSYFGWLSDAINDQFIFGSLYLRGDTSTYPSPIFTFIGTCSFILLLNFGKKFFVFANVEFSIKRVVSFFLGFLTITFIAFYIFLDSRNIDGLAILTTILRRFWISYYLAAIIFSVFSQLRKTYHSYKLNKSARSLLYTRNALVLFSLVGELQVYPLFDQMHFWWGSVPAVILTLIVTKETLIDGIVSPYLKNKMVTAFLLIATLLSLIQMTGQLSKPYARFPQDIAKYLWVSPTTSAEHKQLQEFFSDNVPVDSSVLNLCANSDIFFNDRNIRSATRIFVLWPNITEIASMKREMISSKPDIVLTCSLSRIPSFQQDSEFVQQEILDKSFDTPQVFAILNSSPNMTWQLWKNE
jgi:hypothetical protein